MDKPTCETCEYWDPNIKDAERTSELGTCNIRSISMDHFPSRYYDEFCGEHPDFQRWLDRGKV